MPSKHYHGHISAFLPQVYPDFMDLGALIMKSNILYNNSKQMKTSKVEKNIILENQENGTRSLP